MSQSGGDALSQIPDLMAHLRMNQVSTPSQSYPANTSPHPQLSAPLQAGVMSPGLSSTFNIPHSTPTRTSAAPATQAGLLNLLKFGPNTASPQSSPQHVPASRPLHGSPSTHGPQGRGQSASSDLLASFAGGKTSTPAPREKSQAMPSTNHQDALLRLLNKTTARPDAVQQKSSEPTGAVTKPSSADTVSSPAAGKHPSVTGAKISTTGRHESPIRFFGSNEEAAPTPFEPAVTPQADPSQKNDSIFTYVNPFEQLAASSPRNIKPRTSANGDKRRIKSPSPAALHASSRRKLTPSGSEVLQSIESPTSDNAQHERSQVEALMGIGAPSRDAETVAEALNEVGDKVDRQVESALAQAEGRAGAKGQDEEPAIKQEDLDEAEQATLKDIEARAHDVAADVKKELDKEENQGLLEESMPTPVAEAIKDVIDEAANGNVADDDDTVQGQTITSEAAPRPISVYQFPMRPFVSIDLIQKDLPELKIREDAVIHIARFKKDFDQADRTLATATHDFIVYAMPKNGGIRIIQQDNGQHSSIYSKTQDRIFNVAISTAPPGSPSKGIQAIIATGVSGTVYWTTIARPGEEVTQEHMEGQGLMIPPVSAQTDPTSGGQLKTRAKKSNRHPEFFAIGRGKSIQIIFSSNAQTSACVTKEGLMDSEKYFAERNLKVTTGKAGKDFTFSEDDSAIVSLDKAGKLRIWDIRELTDEANGAVSLMTPIEVKSPILTFSTARSTEKSWPTSVLFVDKLRPYTKGTALRYIIVGMKQNHTLQLWDLCLGKAVQELSFPHESETDAICSVTYHPASGIIAVGHPTRNSIYFIHLSAPKYNLPAMPQAKFVQRLANKDSTLPKAEATAIMSGMREYSFADKGHIRSIELVPSSAEPSRTAEDDDDPTLFELYVLHSKGVTCLGIKREDLGWSKESRVIHPIDAEKGGHVIIKELRESLATSNSEPSISASGDAQAPATPSKAKTPARESARSLPPAAEVGKSTTVTTEKADRKRSKRNGVLSTETAPQAVVTPPISELIVDAGQREATPTPHATPNITQEHTRPDVLKTTSRDGLEAAASSTSDRPTRPIANGDSINVGISGDFLDKELKKIERGVSEEFHKVLGRELETLYKRFSEDKRVQDAAGAAKQDALLRLVSSTLSDNVEQSLSTIIQRNIRDSVVPSITDTTSAVLKANLSSVIAHQIDDKLVTILKQSLQHAMNQTMQNEQVLRSISEQVTKSITGHVEQQFSTALEKTIVPAFTNLAVSVAQEVSGDTERRVREQLQQAEVQHCEDSTKIDQLAGLVRGLSETVQAMAAAQSDFQVEILKQQQKVAENGRTPSHQHSLTPSESVSITVSPEQEELDAVNAAMNEGRFEEATVMWLHSQQQVELFDNLFVSCNPAYLRQTSPLVILSVGAAVTSSLHTNVMERLAWLETVFHSIDTRDPEIREVAGRILEVLSQRLEGEYMRIAETEPQNPALRKIPGLARHARELRGTAP